MQIDTSSRQTRIQAVLGPTNTGKTHYAMERMLAHGSGMIGFPLRLLARENYDRAVKIKGERHVALITGEEKIVPPDARYFLCTVEAMPVDRRVEFLGIDEIQMCADPDRGHLFTQRLLRARGASETMFMGAETIKPLLRELVPEAEITGRPRMSTLRYAGQRKITRLPPRSAVVAFSTADVYAIAELVRRQRGGAAVVLGALSPRTRNAQVAMYQAGEVDYLVATDAIGMGLNMDVDHVAFAQTRKFDGRFTRGLGASELAQIAGRAGRHMNDGTFGTTGDIAPLEAEVVDRIENHAFESLRFLFWRNPDLQFASLDALRHSLTKVLDRHGLVRAREADDELALSALLGDAEVRSATTNPERVRLLWEVAQIPDFRKVMSDAHARLLRRVYLHLTGPEGRLPTDWVAGHVERLDKVEGDIETLMQRIAHIRTWTYVSHRGDWLADAGHWQATTRAIEDRLSDALHERLTHRFVDKRTVVLVSRLKEHSKLEAIVDNEGDVSVEGHLVGSLNGFRYIPDRAEGGAAAKAIMGAALKALRGEIGSRLARLEADGDDAFALAPNGMLLWQGAEVARLAKGADVLRPVVEPLSSDLLEAEDKERIRRRLALWLENHIKTRMGLLMDARETDLKGPARGLVFQLGEALGSLRRDEARDQIEALSQNDRRQLRSLGLRIGRESLYFPALLKPAAVGLRALLWSVANGDTILTPPHDGRMSVPLDAGTSEAFLEAVGYRPLGPLALRIDILERVAARLWRLNREAPFAMPAELLNLVGCSAEVMSGIMKALGYRVRTVKGEPKEEGAEPEETLLYMPGSRRRPKGERKDGERRAKGGPKDKGRPGPKGKPGPGKKRKTGKPASRKSVQSGPPKPVYDPDSPFAKLKDLIPGS